MRPSREYVSGLEDMIRECVRVPGSPMTGVEIGSFAGESAEIMVRTGLVGKLYCVDPWAPGYDPNDGASEPSEMLEAERSFDARFRNVSAVVKLKGMLNEVAHLIGPEPVDFVYIDANHTFESCVKDIMETIELLHPAVVCGHDFSDDWPGVKRAVDHVFGCPDLTFSDTSWLVYYPRKGQRT